MMSNRGNQPKGYPKTDKRVHQKPLDYHYRTGHMIDSGQLRTVKKLEVRIFAKDHEMVLNSSKTKIMLFNKSSKWDFMPEICISEGQNLDVVEEFKILGLTVSTDMRWDKHTKNICRRGYMQLWALRRLKNLGASTDILVDLYEKQIRSILEYAAPAWSPMITMENSNDIERVQKCAFFIIFGPNSYSKTLLSAQKMTQMERRQTLCQKFSVKNS